MTTFVYLVRHAAHELVDRVLVGRAPGVELSRKGWAQAIDLPRRFEALSIAAVQSSPRLRARQTAQCIAADRGLSAEVVDALDELDVGDWTGRSFDELEHDPRWHLWNSQRGRARPPGGEAMHELQMRIVGHLERIHADYEGRSLVMVSHAEPIRAAVLHYLAIPLDDFNSVPIGPASVTTIILRGGSASVLHDPSLKDAVAA